MGTTDLWIAARAGGGPPPGYEWTVRYDPSIRDEALAVLDNDAQLDHVIMQVRELAREKDPTHPLTQSVDAIETFHELRLKGGPLGKKNVRVFFFVDKVSHEIVLLGIYLKTNDGSTRTHVKVQMRNRLRRLVT